VWLILGEQGFVCQFDAKRVHFWVFLYRSGKGAIG
jgi:hypothetical protein